MSSEGGAVWTPTSFGLLRQMDASFGHPPISECPPTAVIATRTPTVSGHPTRSAPGHSSRRASTKADIWERHPGGCPGRDGLRRRPGSPAGRAAWRRAPGTKKSRWMSRLPARLSEARPCPPGWVSRTLGADVGVQGEIVGPRCVQTEIECAPVSALWSRSGVGPPVQVGVH